MTEYVYDVGEKKTGKMLKLSRKYLSWIQDSGLERDLRGNVERADICSKGYEKNELDTFFIVVDPPENIEDPMFFEILLNLKSLYSLVKQRLSMFGKKHVIGHRRLFF